MKNAVVHAKEIEERMVRAGGSVLILDFDGTLADIAPTPDEAHVSPRAQRALRALAPQMPIVVISGRALSDAIKKVGVEGIAYAGNHGLEWKIGNHRDVYEPPAEMRAALIAVRQELHALLPKYQGMLIENKVLTIAAHYRLVDAALVQALRTDMLQILTPRVRAHTLRCTEGKMIFDISPALQWDKGRCARFLFERLRQGSRRHFVPIIIGDDVTDESTFKALRTGITIRVGSHSPSAAEYVFPTRADVDNFLDSLLRTRA